MMEKTSNVLERCPWSGTGTMQAYHDTEWGVPLHDDRLLFEFISLDGAQAGLSWATILNRRNAYREAFDNFVPDIVADYDMAKIEELLINPGIIRNRRKISSVVNNAKTVLDIQREYGSLDKFLWDIVGGKPIVNSWEVDNDTPAKTTLSETMSKTMIRQGFSFVGPTICYAFMQAAGMVNDHLISCFRYKEINEL